LNSFRFFGNAGSFQLAGLNETDRNPSLLVVVLKHGPETGATSAQGAYDARLSSHGTASVVIRVWTLCIIRSVREQRQTDFAVLARRSCPFVRCGQPGSCQPSALSCPENQTPSGAPFTAVSLPQSIGVMAL